MEFSDGSEKQRLHRHNWQEVEKNNRLFTFRKEESPVPDDALREFPFIKKAISVAFGGEDDLEHVKEYLEVAVDGS